MTESSPGINNPHSKRYTLRRPLAILMALLLFLTIPLACSDGGSDSSNGDGNDSNGDDNRNNNDSENGDPPGAPTGLTAAANGSSQIQLSWEAPADDGGSAITGYQIEYREGDGDWLDAAADTGEAEADYDHNGLTGDTQYSYRISAINAVGTGPSSEEATATTTSLADDLKPGVPTNLTATAADGQVTLGWTDPMHCGSGNACSDDNHQHWLEYKLTSAADDVYADKGAVVVSGSAHATTYTVTGLTNGRSYDFRLAVQLNDESDRGPWSEVSAQPQEPSSGFSYACPGGTAVPGSAPQQGTVKCDFCGSGYILKNETCEMDVDSDGDGMLNSIDTDDDNDGILDTSDAFPLDACASVDSDGDGFPDSVIAPGDDAADACNTASPLLADVDDDNDGLIEIATRAELDNIRHNLAGSSYDDEAEDTGSGDTGDTSGAPAAATTHCDTASGVGAGGEDTFLCGYELAMALDLEGSGSNLWDPVGGCGENEKCGEGNSNDDEPFTAIFEGNGFSISNVYIEGSTDRVNALGLFGYLGESALVQNLTIDSIYISSRFPSNSATSKRNRMGGLAGYLTGTAMILNVTLTDSDSNADLEGGVDTSREYVGGLVGYQLNGSITASYAAVDLNGGAGDSDWVGGLVGYQTGGSITASYATGTVDDGGGDDDAVGGLVGQQSGGSITASYATGTAADNGSDSSDTIGGLLGYQSGGSIIASYAAGNVNGGDGNDERVGGLVGYQTGGSIISSYATGVVDGGKANDDKVGGLVGRQNGGSIIASFATGNVNDGGGGGDQVGGLVGYQFGGHITASFATGNADGGAGDFDRVGGLVGYQTQGRITASYATGNADGGAGSGDGAGGLVGGKTGGSISASYSFGTVSGQENAGKDGTAKPSGVTSAAGLTANNSGAGWSADVWDFGSGTQANTQAPALLYVDGYTRGDGPDNMANTSDDTHTYSCDNASFPDSLMVTCGTTLLPGPDESPQDRE